MKRLQSSPFGKMLIMMDFDFEELVDLAEYFSDINDNIDVIKVLRKDEATFYERMDNGDWVENRNVCDLVGTLIYIGAGFYFEVIEK